MNLNKQRGYFGWDGRDVWPLLVLAGIGVAALVVLAAWLVFWLATNVTVALR